jgi:hypothetical protein
VVSINEAREIAAAGLRGRMRDLEAGAAPMCLTCTRSGHWGLTAITA